MIAKAAASLDLMSGGRFELGIGAGAFWDAVQGMGGTVREKTERLPGLGEAIDLIRSALDVGPERRVTRSEGRFYPAHMYPPGPPPTHRVEIWVGAMSPGALRLIGRKADGWVPGGGISRAADFPQLNAHIDEAALAAGREPSEIRRIANVSGLDLRDPASAIGQLTRLGTQGGIDSFVFWPDGAGTADVERFAAEIVPALRERLG
jgi:alkanesulfonate monooxygenase SsuD/methylene tetrahydromethanopterin reductase-like flavin-dependent oxidoreductase (luciferase family)